MAEFILEHWQLVASFVLALVNLVITLCVHKVSTARITNGGSADITSALSHLVDAVSALQEEVHNEKTSK